jgi:hypothetical protein
MLWSNPIGSFFGRTTFDRKRPVEWSSMLANFSSSFSSSYLSRLDFS